MSSASKNNNKLQQIPKNNQPHLDEKPRGDSVPTNLVKNIFTAGNIQQNKQIVQSITSTNLAVVRQVSFSSQDGKSKHNIASKKSQSKQQKQRSYMPKQQKYQDKVNKSEKKEEQFAYDDFNVLKISGLLDAYQHFLKLLCKHGLPTGKIFDYAAQQILKYEKKKINKELKMRAQLDIQKILKKNDKGSPSPQRVRESSPYYH